MGKRGNSKRLFPKRFASDYIPTGQRPRFLITDGAGEWCRKCNAYLKDQVKARKCIQETCLALAQGDNWFDNQARIRTTEGPKNNRTPVIDDNPYVEEGIVRVKDYRGRVTLRSPKPPQGTPRDPFSVYRGDTVTTRPVTKSIPETKGIGTPTSDTGDIKWAEKRLPKNVNKETIKKLSQSDREAKKTVSEILEVGNSDYKQWVATYNHQVRWRHPVITDWCIKIFFSGDRYRWVEEKDGIAKISIIYRGRKKAERAYETRIVWSESFEL